MDRRTQVALAAGGPLLAAVAAVHAAPRRVSRSAVRIVGFSPRVTIDAGGTIDSTLAGADGEPLPQGSIDDPRTRRAVLLALRERVRARRAESRGTDEVACEVAAEPGVPWVKVVGWVNGDPFGGVRGRRVRFVSLGSSEVAVDHDWTACERIDFVDAGQSSNRFLVARIDREDEPGGGAAPWFVRFAVSGVPRGDEPGRHAWPDDFAWRTSWMREDDLAREIAASLSGRGVEAAVIEAPGPLRPHVRFGDVVRLLRALRTNGVARACFSRFE